MTGEAIDGGQLRLSFQYDVGLPDRPVCQVEVELLVHGERLLRFAERVGPFDDSPTVTMADLCLQALAYYRKHQQGLSWPRQDP